MFITSLEPTDADGCPNRAAPLQPARLEEGAAALADARSGTSATAVSPTEGPCAA